MTDRTQKKQEKRSIPVTFENLRTYGIEAFDEQEVFLMCTKKIREEGQTEDDFLLYLAFEVMKRGYYDKALLTYLATFYCGATRDMKLVWKRAKEYEVETHCAFRTNYFSDAVFGDVCFGGSDFSGLLRKEIRISA